MVRAGSCGRTVWRLLEAVKKGSRPLVPPVIYVHTSLQSIRLRLKARWRWNVPRIQLMSDQMTVRRTWSYERR